MSKAKAKSIIEISSSSSDEVIELSSSTSSDQSEDEYTDDEEEDSNESSGDEFGSGSIDKDDDFDDLDDAAICTRILQLIRDGDDLQGLGLNKCKVYLRSKGLRLSGTRAECIGRIKEHWRLKNGSGEGLYPRSSFTIDCTGDVCKGDVVLFTQKVLDRMKRSGSVSGKRTIAGRIVKESYGAAKQQHTFTVEVLWSKGLKTLPPLYPLLVKGRNLYRLRTFRQRWKNEGERSLVLVEKHDRGAAARSIRAMRKREFEKRTEASTSRKTGRAKHQKRNHPSRQGQRKETSNVVKGKGVGVKYSAGKKRSYDYHDEFLPHRQLNLEKATTSSHKRQRLIHTNPFRESLFQCNPGHQPRRLNSLPHQYSHSTYLPNSSYYPGHQPRRLNNLPHQYSHSTYLPTSSYYPGSFAMPVEHQQLARASYPQYNLPNVAFEDQSRNSYHLPRR